MIEVVGILRKTGFLSVDCELNLANEAVVELDVDEDIVGLCPQPILDPYNLQSLWVAGTDRV